MGGWHSEKARVAAGAVGRGLLINSLGAGPWGRVMTAGKEEAWQPQGGGGGTRHSQTLPWALITPSMEGLCDSNHTNPPGVWHCPQGTENDPELQGREGICSRPLPLESCGVRVGTVLPETYTGTATPGLQGEPLFALGSSVGSPQVLWILESSPHPVLVTPTLGPQPRLSLLPVSLA